MTDGWRCRECGTIVCGQACSDGDDVALQQLADGADIVGSIGCPVCPYQTPTDPVSVQVYARDVTAPPPSLKVVVFPGDGGPPRIARGRRVAGPPPR